MQDIGLIGVPSDAGAGERGACLGPEALRIAGLADALTALGYAVTDHGDLPGPKRQEPAAPSPSLLPANGSRNFDAVSAWCRLTSDKTFEVAQSGQLPVILGGDHSIAMGSVNGVARHCREVGRELFVLWLDAHADFNTPASSPSGNMHGMPVAAFCGAPNLAGVLGPERTTPVEPGNVTLFGIRSVDRPERAAVARRGVHVVDMRTIDERGIVAALKPVIDEVRVAGGHLHVSLDVDFLDPSLAPGVGTTVPGGATWREAHFCMELLHEAGIVGSMDIVELNPFLDVRGASATVLVELTASLFGKTIIDRPLETRRWPGRACRRYDDAGSEPATDAEQANVL
ncbi:MAG TPA: arginase [Afifellaceae bacterium]|nr:arginase [Afifellaceae bacterium]